MVKDIKCDELLRDNCMIYHLQVTFLSNCRKKEEEEKESEKEEVVISQKTSRRVSRANSRASRLSTAPAPLQVINFIVLPYSDLQNILSYSILATLHDFTSH
jgi:hypothetical protein